MIRHNEATDSGALVETEGLLADLIAIDSTNPDLGRGAGESEIAGFVLDWLVEREVDAWLQDTGHANRPNVIGRVVGGDGPTLMLNGHLDTVGVGHHDDPFTPRVEAGRMHGRGSLDTKGGVAALMAATAVAASEGTGGTVLFTGVADEEYASFGTEAVVSEYTADAAIVTEPSRLEVSIAHKGFVWFEIETFGFAAHGSKPDLGIDAIAKMGKVLAGIESLGDALASGGGHSLLGTGSVHASLIEGGQEASSYPGRCVLTVERRTVPGETIESTLAELSELIDGCTADDPDFSATVRHTFSRQPYEIEPQHPIVELLSTHVERVVGAPVHLTGHSGWMDTAILGAAGIAAVVIGPSGEGLHGDVEWVELDSVRQVREVVSGFIKDFCG